MLRPEVEANVRSAAAALIADAGLVQVDVEVAFPGLGFEWAMSNLCQLAKDLDGLWPDCRDDLTREMALGFEMAFATYDLAMAARVERSRTELNEQMASVFDEVDFVISATNPDVAYPAHITANTRVGETKVGLENNGVLTIPANIVGNPAVSVPVQPAFGLPVGMQVMARHHEDELLLDLARIVEQTLPWPRVAPTAPC